MENAKLMVLLESDREMILAAVARDRTPAAVQAALEKALDRVALRFAEQCEEARTRQAAQLMLSAMKSALPLMDSVGEVRRWQRDTTASDRPRPGALAWTALVGGAVLTLSAVMALAFSGDHGGLLTALRAIVPALLGLAAVFWAGMKFAAPAKADETPNVREEFLVDADKLWHRLRGMLLVADNALEGVRAEADTEARHTATVSAGPVARAETELFSGLLESIYAMDGADAREMAEDIRFYLHGAGVEVVDCAPGRERWFEFLPSQRPGTLRPALVSEDKLIKKGLAAAERTGV